MLENIVLGIIQGIAEWLPISSEGMIFLAKEHFFQTVSIQNTIALALTLHLGTFLAALIYFWKDVKNIVLALFFYRKADRENQLLLIFLFFTTVISGIIGGLLLISIGEAEQTVQLTGKAVTLIIGVLLLGTAIVQLKTNSKGQREVKNIGKTDITLLGAVQGFTVLPGFSRSGFTIATLLLRKFSDDQALRLSFLMSLPVVLGANIVMPFVSTDSPVIWSLNMLWGILASFIFGLLTIHVLLKIAKKLNFGWFVLFFAIITIIASFFA